MSDLMVRLAHELGAREESAPTVVGAECVRANDGFGNVDFVGIHGTGCRCAFDYDTSYVVLDAPGWCAVRGHSHDCLMQHGEIEACDLGDSHSCDATCDELSARLAVDAMTSKPFALRSAQCGEVELEGEYGDDCAGVVEIEGFCYPAIPGLIDWGGWQSCELSHAEVLAAPRNPLPDCDAFPETFPQTSECIVTCDTAATCAQAEGCWYGPDGNGFGVSNRGICAVCMSDEACLPNETCAHGACLLPENVECDDDAECGGGQACYPEGISESQEPRGNEAASTHCAPL